MRARARVCLCTRARACVCFQRPTEKQCAFVTKVRTHARSVASSWRCLFTASFAQNFTYSVIRSRHLLAVVFAHVTCSQWHSLTLLAQSGILSYYLLKVAFSHITCSKWHSLTLLAHSGILSHYLLIVAFSHITCSKWHSLILLAQSGILSHYLLKVAFSHITYSKWHSLTLLAHSGIRSQNQLLTVVVDNSITCSHSFSHKTTYSVIRSQRHSLTEPPAHCHMFRTSLNHNATCS